METNIESNLTKESLTDYLIRHDREYVSIISEINNVLLGIALLFAQSRVDDYWPPEWDESQREKVEKGKQNTKKSDISPSTQAMCILATQKLQSALSKEEQEIVGFDHTQWKEKAKEQVDAELKKGKIPSSTYGDNSPVVLNYLLQADLIHPDQLALDMQDRLDKCLEKPDVCLPIELDSDGPVGDNIAGSHAFPLLGTIRFAKKLNKSLSLAGRWFEQRMHEQVSYERVNDFKFDAAELTFALLGALESGVILWESDIVRQILNIIRSAQKRSVYWRPYRPFVATKKGLCLLNLSVEVANALIQIIRFPKGESEQSFNLQDDWQRNIQVLDRFSENKAALAEYYNWLISQRQKFIPVLCAERDNGRSIEPIGWLSENVQVSSPKRIHIWATAQVASFLIEYRYLLKMAARHELLQHSRFSYKPPHEMLPWEKIVPIDKDRIKREGELKDGVLGIIEKYYIKASKNEKYKKSLNNRRYSMLLYGPPGTSKTTIAQSIARELNWPLITISPSDFLTDGMDQVEFRAKTIFDILMRLEDVVVLFDEIDQLMPDRQAQDYKVLQGVLKFMTPSMLVKLNDLRKSKRLIFIVATNYIERIDEAIKRKGRFDDQFLILPFDLHGRKKVLEKEGNLPKGAIEGLAVGSVLGVYEELKDLATKVWEKNKCKENAVVESLKEFQPSIENHLKRRMEDLKGTLDEKKKANQFPFDEILCLYGLLVEVDNAPFFPETLNEFLLVKAAIKEKLRERFEKLFKDRKDISDDWKNRLGGWLKRK